MQAQTLMYFLFELKNKEEEFQEKVKKLKGKNDSVLRINVNKEDPTVLDAKQLRATSSKKLWKKKHGIKKKVDKKRLKKGFYN